MRIALHWQIAIALGAAIVAGALIGDAAWFMQVCTFVGTLFLNALRMLIVPLIVASMIQALLGLAEQGTLSRLGGRAVAYFLGTTLVAVLTGLILVNLVAPGIIDGEPAGPRLGLAADTEEVLAGIEDRGGADIIGVLLRMVPPNLIAAAAETEMLGLIFFSLLFGFFASRLPETQAHTQRQFWGGLYEIMLRITGLVMRFAPLGVFALVGRTVAQTGWGAVEPLLLFVLVVTGGLAIHAFITLPLLVRAISGVPPRVQLRNMSPAMLMAFSTSSSAATLPVTFECVQNRAGVPRGVAGFVLPLGATVNMNGTALYECAAAIFIAQAYGLELSFLTQFVIVSLALITSIGVAGVPAASLVAIAVILSAIGLPLEGVGLILAVDRILDMCRTAVNVFGDACGAVIVAGRRHGEAAPAADATADA
jgi:proton glutamate symport protein